jgi:MFS family permease
MGRFTYYSPSVVGFVLALLSRDLYKQSLPIEDSWQHWVALLLVAVAAGLLAQFLMVGVQGLFAQVLPVPGGRSIRGRAAVTAGGFSLAGVALGIVAAMLAAERGDDGVGTLLGWVTVGVTILAGAALMLAAAVYVWNWPAAERDFAADRRGAPLGEKRG